MGSLLDTLWSVGGWLASPNVIPLAGVLAAVLAAFSVDTKLWLRSPGTFFRRVLRVTAIWLVVAWLVCGAAMLADAGRGQGASSDEESASGAPVEPPRATQKAAGVVAEPFPAASQEVVLIIQFLPLPGKPDEARDRCCDLVFRTPEGARRIEIRAADMLQFTDELAAALKRRELPADVDHPVVVIHRRPFAGEGTLRRISQLVQESWPGVSVQFSEGTSS
jgi:hypothetical protein